MKRIPAGLILAAAMTMAAHSLLADESAEQLANQQLGQQQNLQDESAQQLSNQSGAPTPSFTDESAGQLGSQSLGTNPSLQDESAQQLSTQSLGVNPSLTDESASQLAGQDGLNGKKHKKSDTQGNTTQSVFAGTGVDGTIYAMTVQSDGKVVIGGRFSNVNGQPRQNLARLNSDGSLDASFLAGGSNGVDGTVFALAHDKQGNILVGGNFNAVQDASRRNFVRLQPNGQLDTSFANGQSPNGAVHAISLSPKGNIFIGGKFDMVGQAVRHNLAEFGADGTLSDPSNFADTGAGNVLSLAALGHGVVVAGGQFEVAGQSAKNVLLSTP
jgi:hypothetical protein